MLGWLLRRLKGFANMADVKSKVEEAQKSIDFAKNTYTVELTTNKGPIRLEFLPDVAPGHVKNFVGLAKIGFYDGIIFHRVIGDFMMRVMRGGDTLGALTLSRFFAIHVLFLPGILVGLIGLHLFILRRVGPAGPWTDERSSLTKETFYPRQVYMDAVMIGVVFLLVAAAALVLPFPLTDKADPSDTSFVPVPEWYFLFYYELLKYVHGPLEPLATWILPMGVILIMLLWPFIDRNPARNPIRRPVALGAGAVFLAVVLALLGLSVRNLYAVPRIDPAVARGKALYAEFGCAGCHRIHGVGGAVAPDLSFVGDTRPEREWHLKHFKDPQSVSPGSFMPKFPLTDRQLHDLTSYMLSLKQSP